MQAKDWKAAVNMYRNNESWDDSYRVCEKQTTARCSGLIASRGNIEDAKIKQCNYHMSENFLVFLRKAWYNQILLDCVRNRRAFCSPTHAVFRLHKTWRPGRMQLCEKNIVRCLYT